MNDFPSLEDLIQVKNFLYDIDFVDGAMIGDLSRKKVCKLFNTFQVLRYNSHVCYISNINVLFEAYRCPSRDHFLIPPEI